jgi:hypothetical protein
MGLLITISDGTSQTDIRSGIKPRTKIWPMGSIVTAGVINFWDDSQLVLTGSSATGFTSTQDWPFTDGGGGGDCLFNTGSLFCFNGAMNAPPDNVLMVLWNFPVKPQAEDGSGNGSGDGYLNSPPATGLIAGGPITWEITSVM